MLMRLFHFNVSVELNGLTFVTSTHAQARYIHPHWLTQPPTSAQLNLVTTTNHHNVVPIPCPRDFGKHITEITYATCIQNDKLDPVLEVEENSPPGSPPTPPVNMLLRPWFHHELFYVTSIHEIETGKLLPSHIAVEPSQVSNPRPATKQGRRKKDPRIPSPLEAAAVQRKRPSDVDVADDHENKRKRPKTALPRQKGKKGQSSGTQLNIELL